MYLVRSRIASFLGRSDGIELEEWDPPRPPPRLLEKPPRVLLELPRLLEEPRLEGPPLPPRPYVAEVIIGLSRGWGVDVSVSNTKHHKVVSGASEGEGWDLHVQTC